MVWVHMQVTYVIVLPRSPGIYGCKLPEREGAARGWGLFSTINTMATVVELFYILPPYLIGQRRYNYNYHDTDRKQ